MLPAPGEHGQTIEVIVKNLASFDTMHLAQQLSSGNVRLVPFYTYTFGSKRVTTVNATHNKRVRKHIQCTHNYAHVRTCAHIQHTRASAPRASAQASCSAL